MLTLEADGPPALAEPGQQSCKLRKPRQAARFAVLRAPAAPASDIATSDATAQAENRPDSFSGRRTLPARRIIPALLIAIAAAGAVLLGVAALAGIKSGFFSDGNAAFAVTRITVIDGNETRLVFTHAKTVGEVMALLGIQPDEDDYINMSPDAPVVPDMTLEYHSVEYKKYVVDEILYHGTKTVELQTIPRGEKTIVRQGKNGSLYREVLAEYRDGKLFKEDILKEEYVPPVDEIVEVGVGGTIVGADGKTYNFSHYIDVFATAYAAEGITYTGKEARAGIVAVDPSVIPLGTKLYIRGDYADIGVCTADDIGAGIKGNHIDICMEADIEYLFEFGIRPMRAYILEE